MSTFPGRMREYRNLSIDRFDGVNLESTAYFLSHNHSDHTQGLHSGSLAYRLQSNSHMKLYCSQVTKDLLLADEKGSYQDIADNIVALSIDEPHQIPIPNLQNSKEHEVVTVTLLHAEHCPGSVMFLFEGSEGTVLYTGDFRLNKRDIENMIPLHNGDQPKQLKSMYVDTTFCVPNALFIPSREESAVAAIDITREWLDKSEDHFVVIGHKAALGYENLYKRLTQEFCMKVHVDGVKYSKYKKVGDMSDYTTSDPNQTRIHACRTRDSARGRNVLPCGHTPSDCSKPQVCVLTLSTMAFVHYVGLDKYSLRINENFHRVCYSFHSSFSEIREIVMYLNPARLSPNVIPLGEDESTIQKRLDHLLELAQTSREPDSACDYKPLGKLKRRRKKSFKKISNSQESNESLDFGVPDTPPKKRLKLSESSKEDSEDVRTTVAPAANEDEEEEDYGSDYQPTDDEDTEGERYDNDDWLTQDDLDARKQFTPLDKDSYGCSLGYISEEEEDNNYPCESNVPQESGDAKTSVEKPTSSEGPAIISTDNIGDGDKLLADQTVADSADSTAKTAVQVTFSLAEPEEKDKTEPEKKDSNAGESESECSPVFELVGNTSKTSEISVDNSVLNESLTKRNESVEFIQEVTPTSSRVLSRLSQESSIIVCDGTPTMDRGSIEIIENTPVETDQSTLEESILELGTPPIRIVPGSVKGGLGLVTPKDQIFSMDDAIDNADQSRDGIPNLDLSDDSSDVIYLGSDEDDFSEEERNLEPGQVMYREPGEVPGNAGPGEPGEVRYCRPMEPGEIDLGATTPGILRSSQHSKSSAADSDATVDVTYTASQMAAIKAQGRLRGDMYTGGRRLGGQRVGGVVDLTEAGDDDSEEASSREEDSMEEGEVKIFREGSGVNKPRAREDRYYDEDSESSDEEGVIYKPRNGPHGPSYPHPTSRPHPALHPHPALAEGEVITLSDSEDSDQGGGEGHQDDSNLVDSNHGDSKNGNSNHGDSDHGDGNQGDGNHGDGNQGDGYRGDGNHGDGRDQKKEPVTAVEKDKTEQPVNTEVEGVTKESDHHGNPEQESVLSETIVKDNTENSCSSKQSESTVDSVATNGVVAAS